jgi:hypothetical protein
MAFYNGSTASVYDCTCHGNRAQFSGGSFCSFESSPTVSNCTFVADSVGYGGALYFGPEESPTIEATIIAYCKNGCAVSSDNPPATPTVTCCDLFGNEAGDWVGCVAGMDSSGGNMHLEPLFCDIPTGDLSVEDCSPCLSENNDCGVDVGGVESGCLCGQAVEPTTWGKIKADFKD